LNFQKVKKNTPKKGTFFGKFPEKVRFFQTSQKFTKIAPKKALFLGYF
jgi:hypothetical protein